MSSQLSCLLLLLLADARTEAAPRSRTEVSGCLAKKAHENAPEAREMTREARPAKAPPVDGKQPALTVEHRMRHACCLESAVQTLVKARRVEIVVRLSGTPCRCLCESTLRTSIDLRPGSYAVTIWVEQAGRRWPVGKRDRRAVVTAGQPTLLVVDERAEQQAP